ncbi:DNA polymerase-3 subunit epsilon [Mucilaginibacter gracilis]|uniref:DNA polymerase-3 subunit epsilon n=1 Tax=Mucilaginibacter gracilis TaxID=423350 RepID=A0A495J967_9SPHI|nr:3'-5' exonuclease [Mucilaginibacter gracilis]RKR84932.1 DNA polymerase-3 subunit epsilon [Mucilaginibacter gracilis]
MQNHILFIDTETTGLPIDWTQPYSNNANWPYAVQVSWIIYTRDGAELKREDHYISDNDFEISPQALKIHGITRDFLTQNGQPRKFVMDLLYADLKHYQPMVVGHYMELDYNITGADFYRLGMDNPIASLPMYCTMLGSSQYTRNPQATYLRLGQLYSTLFNKPLHHQHNAMVDAEATAACFFEILRNGGITDGAIEKQRADRERRRHQPALKSGCGLSGLLLFAFTLLIAYWL